MERKLTCINCPFGCSLTVTIEEDKISVSGNRCKRGEAYGIKEVTNPTRTVTGSVRVKGGELPLVSVKTVPEIPKDKISEVMQEIHGCTICAPVSIGDTIISNVAGTGADIVATRNLCKREGRR